LFFCVSKALLKKFENFLFFSLLQINIFLVFSDYFDALISKIILKNNNNIIILMHFQVKNTMKSNRNHVLKHKPNIL
jgi:hypothetical protein